VSLCRGPYGAQYRLRDGTQSRPRPGHCHTPCISHERHISLSLSHIHMYTGACAWLLVSLSHWRPCLGVVGGGRGAGRRASTFVRGSALSRTALLIASQSACSSRADTVPAPAPPALPPLPGRPGGEGKAARGAVPIAASVVVSLGGTGGGAGAGTGAGTGAASPGPGRRRKRDDARRSAGAEAGTPVPWPLPVTGGGTGGGVVADAAAAAAAATRGDDVGASAGRGLGGEPPGDAIPRRSRLARKKK
jgi:hypothetical protein